MNSFIPFKEKESSLAFPLSSYEPPDAIYGVHTVIPPMRMMMEQR